MTDALVLRGLNKTFRKPAVNDLDLTVRSGELYALLGPNGAGKTTTLRMVAGLLRPDSGTIGVFGIDVLAEAMVAGLIALATGVAAAGSAWAVVPAVVAGGLLLALRRTDAQIARVVQATD